MGDLQDIAIVGIGCRFPGADNLEEFWRVLTKGENHVKEVPASRWNLDVFFDPDPNTPGKTYVRNAGFVKGVEEWDHRFFGLNDMEAELVDPQQRLVLECVHMALEDGGIRRNDIDGSDTAVYIGSMTDDYKGHVMDDVGLSSAYSVTGTHNSIISARVSYNYNLLGPSLTLDTACSSSLVAIDLASQAIHTGICTLAICGGVNVLLDPQMFIALAKARMLSPSGQCKTFTKEADGYARGEGCGIVILKKLKQAIKDGNKIWSIIKTGVNQDGHMTTPITAPSGLQQERLIKRTYARYNIDTSCIQVIEAHGTGTLIGDPTEINALGAHFGKKANSQSPVYVGSVKTNIGHLEAAAGVAGLIKVLLMIKYHTIVPSLWYKKDNENPKLKMSDHGFIVPTECTNWCKSESEKRLACVNSFGFGGTNAHAIIEEYQESKPKISSAVGTINTFPYIITFSAIDRYSLKENMQSTRNALESNSYDLSSLSCTSTCKRDHFKERKAVFGKTHEEIMSALKKSLEADDEPVKVTMTKRIVFVFCGVGTSWKGMCNSLMKIKAFRSAVKQIDQVLQPLSGWAVAELFQNSLDFQADPMKAHIAIFACQVGLTMLWKHIGITPDAIVGQSVGEVAAAFAANYFDLETAVNIIYNRSKVLASVNQGGMIVVSNVDVEIIEKLCQTVGSVIAVYNSPVSCTVSGSIDQVDRLKYQLSKPEYSNAKIIRLDVKCAYHSHFVEQAALHLREQLEGMSCAGGNIAVFSTVTGRQESSYTIGKSSYWEKNVKMPVLFSQAIKKQVQIRVMTYLLKSVLVQF